MENDLQCRLLNVGLEDLGKKLTSKQSLGLLKRKTRRGSASGRFAGAEGEPGVR